MLRVVLVIWLAVISGAATADSAKIIVSGQGEVSAAPDMAVVSVGVTNEARTASAALAANSQAMGAVLQRLRDAGVAERDLQTSNLSLSPRWDQPSQVGTQPRIVAFLASNQLSVRVRALEELGSILDIVVQDGANTLGGLSFAVAEPEPLLDEARVAAVADATRKARLLSEAAGVTLGPLLEMSESSGGGGPIPMARMEMSLADAVPVASGELEMSATVTMVFATAE